MRNNQAPFPKTRFRRTRASAAVRALVRENRLSVDDLIWPVFVREGHGIEEPVASMPGVHRFSVNCLVKAAKEAHLLGIPAICIFPYTDPSLKTETCEIAWDPDNIANRAIAEIKAAVPDLAIMTDIALDPYNANGHDGIVRDGIIVNDETVEALVKMALAQARAGADILGPSDMMDGRIGAIRHALEKHGFTNTKILAYSAKYASSFYGPFRDAVGSDATLGNADKNSYQMDPANTNEALKEVAMDLAEGADMVMVKPGTPYLDIIYRIKQEFKTPTFAYHVSGEFAMIKAAAQNGWIDEKNTVMESMLGFKRAGADAILTYYAKNIAQWLKEHD